MDVEGNVEKEAMETEKPDELVPALVHDLDASRDGTFHSSNPPRPLLDLR